MKTRNGIWMSDFYLSNGERVRKSLKTKDKAEAKRLQSALQTQLEKTLTEAPAKTVAGLSSAPRGVTLKEAFRRSMLEHERWRASGDKKTINDNYKHISNYFQDGKLLSSFTRAEMLIYVSKLREKGLSGSTINQRLSLVSILIKCSQDWPGQEVEPFKMPRQKVNTGRIRVLSYDEEFKVIKYFLESPRKRGHDKDMAELVKFLVDTGFRLGEAIRLRSDEIHWELNMVPAWETKTKEPRLVPMTKRVRALLEARETLERPFGMFSVDSADDHWEIMRDELKIDPEKDPEFVIHALRHTCASRLCASGMDAFRVQKWMGHKNIQTTQKYVTLFGSDLLDLAHALDARRTTAALKQPFYGPKSAPRGVPKRVPKMASVDAIKVPEGLTERIAAQGIRPSTEQGHTVQEGLLIRRSLVRAQVGEPPSSGDTDEVHTNVTSDCAQDCD